MADLGTPGEFERERDRRRLLLDNTRMAGQRAELTFKLFEMRAEKRRMIDSIRKIDEQTVENLQKVKAM